MIRLSGLQWLVGTRRLTRHLSRARQDDQTAKHHLWKALNNDFKSCVDGWANDADQRKCIRAVHAAPAPGVVYISPAPVVYAARAVHLLTHGISTISWS